MIRCKECGSAEVQSVAWIDPNKQEILDDFGSWGEIDTKFCSRCDDHVELEDDGVSTVREWYNTRGRNIGLADSGWEIDEHLKGLTVLSPGTSSREMGYRDDSEHNLLSILFSSLTEDEATSLISQGIL